MAIGERLVEAAIKILWDLLRQQALRPAFDRALSDRALVLECEQNLLWLEGLRSEEGPADGDDLVVVAKQLSNLALKATISDGEIWSHYEDANQFVAGIHRA